VQRCAAGATLYLPATGSACGPAAIGAFTVAPIMPRSRRRLLGVAVQPTGLGQRVRIECVARCGRTRPVLAAKSKRGATDVMFDGWRVPRLATIEVRVEQPDTTTRYRRFSVRRTFPFLVDRGGGCRLPIGIEAPC